MKKILIILMLSLFTFSCDYFSSDKNEEVFLIVKKKIIEEYKNSKLISKIEYNYEYERINDFFWKSATVEAKLTDIKFQKLYVAEIIGYDSINNENSFHLISSDTTKTLDSAHDTTKIHNQKNQKMPIKKDKNKISSENEIKLPLGKLCNDPQEEFDRNIFEKNKTTKLKIKRLLDTLTRVPVQELIYSKKQLIVKRKLTYSAKTYELIELLEFAIKKGRENKSWYLKRNYSNDMLESEKIEKFDYPTQSIIYKNIYPSKNLIKGYFNIFSYIIIDYRKNEFEQATKTKNGYPNYYILRNPNKDSLKFIELSIKRVIEDGKLTKLKTYNFKKKDSANKYNYEFLFEYNADGLIERIEEYKFNPNEREYDLFRNLQLFEWIDPEIPGRYNYKDFNFSKESYDYKTRTHSLYEKKIVRFDEVGKKVVEEYFDSYNGEYNSGEFKLKLIKRTTILYDRLEKKGEAIVIKKNRKVR